MSNPKITVGKDVLTIVIDTSKEARAAAKLSASGKTKVLSSTHGFSKYEDMGVSLNVTIPNS